MKKVAYSLFMVLISSSLLAQTKFDYPELMVSPSASEQVKAGAIEEKDRGFLNFHTPMMISATTTFIAGIMQFSDVDTTKDVDEYSPLAGVVVGGAWLAGHYFMNTMYRPYTEGYRKISKMPARTKREQLVRERRAEEVIDNAGRLARKMMWFSTLTNAGASAYMISKVKSESMGQLVSGVSILASFLPMIFQSPWQETRCRHKEYKKRIYAPIAYNTLLVDPSGKSLAPGFSMTYSF